MTLDLDQHLTAIVAGDLDAFGHWVAGAEPELRRSLRSFAVHVDTEAMVQEGMLRIWQLAARHAGDGRSNSLLRLAVRVTRNLAIDELRRQRVSAAVLAELAAKVEEPVAPAVPDPFVRQAIAECRDKLTGSPAKALQARLDEAGATSDHTLAARIGMRLNTFLQNVTRARKLLAGCLERKGVDLTSELS